MAVTGTIFNIQRYSINDGPGIRTCVFLKGCPLNCIWCHNPESKSSKPELSFAESKCIGCVKCVTACPNGCHVFLPEGHKIDRSKCVHCGACVDVCCGALEVIGRQRTAEEVIAEACKDKPFYETSGGGVTFTGGEPFAQPAFLLEMLRLAKQEGLHVCVETCGFVRREILEQAMEYVDLFLFDYKETDPEKHKTFTGVEPSLIRDNLQFLAENGKQIVLRCPIIPGCNDTTEHLEAIGLLAERYDSIIRVDVEPYHPLGKTKAAQLGKEYVLPELGMTDSALAESWIQTIRTKTTCEVRKG